MNKLFYINKGQEREGNNKDKKIKESLFHFSFSTFNFQLSTIILLLPFFISCSVSYSFQGGKINYDLVKTITIQDFPNRATYVHPTLGQMFDQALRNRFIEQTRLVAVPNNGDIEIDGEITGYDIQGMAVKEDAFASRTRLTITIRVRYINNKEPDGDVDRSFSASREFDSSQAQDMSVQENLNQEIVDELIDMIYNATVANW
ncbi:LPS assembly lipoprotein LptE [Bacteroidales bacterium OttesenSCG-928-M06]|nr:LPS assembly lipoprotein LptE [Bacteroidales bacterium OttesenSCG-928-M06]